MSDLLDKKSFDKGEIIKFAAFPSIHNDKGEIQDNINFPKFKGHIKIKQNEKSNTKTSVTFSLPKYKEAETLEFNALWLTITLPNQTIDNPSNNFIEYNTFINAIDLIKKIEISDF